MSQSEPTLLWRQDEQLPFGALNGDDFGPIVLLLTSFQYESISSQPLTTNLHIVTATPSAGNFVGSLCFGRLQSYNMLRSYNTSAGFKAKLILSSHFLCTRDCCMHDAHVISLAIVCVTAVILSALAATKANFDAPSCDVHSTEVSIKSRICLRPTHLCLVGILIKYSGADEPQYAARCTRRAAPCHYRCEIFTNQSHARCYSVWKYGMVRSRVCHRPCMCYRMAAPQGCGSKRHVSHSYDVDCFISTSNSSLDSSLSDGGMSPMFTFCP